MIWDKNVQVKSEEVSDDSCWWDKFGIFDMYDDGDHFWFTSLEYNALFTMDKCTNNINYVGSFPNEEYFQYRLYASINEYAGKLYFTPCSAHEIGVYDMKNRQFEKIDIGIPRQDNDLSQIRYAKKFVEGFFYNNKLILIPCCYENTIAYDAETGEVGANGDLFEYFYAKYRNSVTSFDQQFYLCWYAKNINTSEIVFDLHCNANIVIFYNLQTGEFREQVIGSENRTFSYIEYAEKQIYLYDEKADKVIKWGIEDGRYTESSIAENISDFIPCGVEHSFVNITILGKWLFLIPANTNLAIKVDRDTLRMEVVDELSRECAVSDKGIAYINLGKVSENRLFLVGNRSKRIVIYKENGEIQYIPIKVSEYDAEAIESGHLAELMRNGLLFYEEGSVSLNIFLSAVASMET